MHRLGFCIVSALVLQQSSNPSAAPESVVDWMREHAHVLTGVTPGQERGDLAPLNEMIGSARVVGIGEVTHGSRELFQLKHRLVEHLITELEFNIIAIEASYPDCVPIDTYIRTGEGEAEAVLFGQRFWTLDTESMLEFLRWMRAYNADPENACDLRFIGVDMQYPQRASDVALGAIADEKVRRNLTERLAPLERATIRKDYSSLAEDRRNELTAAANELLERLQDASPAIRQHAEIVSQFERRLRDESGTLRDELMADNIKWVLDHSAPEDRVIFWAHNGHVMRPNGMWPTGSKLAERLGSDYFALGTVFESGSFQARAFGGAEVRDGVSSLQEHAVPAPKLGSIGQTLGRVEHPAFLLGLGDAPSTGEVHAWLAGWQPVRTIGSQYNHATDADFYQQNSLTECWDAIVFIRELTRARPNARTRQRFGLDSTSK